jgi:hypothetical protein
MYRSLLESNRLAWEDDQRSQRKLRDFNSSGPPSPVTQPTESAPYSHSPPDTRRSPSEASGLYPTSVFGSVTPPATSLAPITRQTGFSESLGPSSSGSTTPPVTTQMQSTYQQTSLGASLFVGSAEHTTSMPSGIGTLETSAPPGTTYLPTSPSGTNLSLPETNSRYSPSAALSAALSAMTSFAGTVSEGVRARLPYSSYSSDEYAQ